MTKDNDTTPAKAGSNSVRLLAVLAALGTLSTNIILPSFPSIGADMGVTIVRLGLTLSSFFLVFAIGQLIVGPLSDRVGRFWPVVIGMVIFVVGCFVCASATDFNMLLLGRVIQAAGVCAASVLSRAIARDLFEGVTLMKAMSFMMVASAAAPGFSPLVGALLESSFGWQSTFWFTAIVAVLATLWYAFAVGETHVRQEGATVNPVLSYAQIGSKPAFLAPAFATAFIIGGLFGFFSAAPSILQVQMGLSAITVGWFFASTVFVVFAAGAVASALVKQGSPVFVSMMGLFVASLGGLGLVASGMLDAGNLVTFTVSTVIFLFGMGLALPLCTGLALTPFSDLAGAASSLLGFLQMLGAAVGTGLIATLAMSPVVSLGLVQAVGCFIGLLGLVVVMSWKETGMEAQ